MGGLRRPVLLMWAEAGQLVAGVARTPALSQLQPEGMCRPGDSERTCAPPPCTGTNTGPRALLRR